MTSARTEELVKYDREHILHAQIPLGETLGVIYDSAEGIVLRDTEGKEYLDASSQMVSANLGHGRREIIEAVKTQLDKLQHVGQYYGHSSTPMVECAQKLATVTPGDLDHFWFTSGGGESTDAAIRLVRRYFTAVGQPTKRKVISLYMSYHGTGNGPMNLTGIPAMQAGYGPEAPGYLKIPAYYCYRCPFGLEYPSCDTRCARFLETVIESEGPENIAAFIAEPELGASGFLVPPDTYWPLIREICTRYDVAMIADEVMCGFCRTGTMFCIDHWNVVPDVIAMSKGITGGYVPMGAVAFNDKIWSGLEGVSLMHQYTFSGSPAGCAAAIAADRRLRERPHRRERDHGGPPHRRAHRERVHADALRRHPQRPRPHARHGDRRRQEDEGHVRSAGGADHAAARRGPREGPAPAADGLEPHRDRAALHHDDRRGRPDRRHSQAPGGGHRAADEGLEAGDRGGHGDRRSEHER